MEWMSWVLVARHGQLAAHILARLAATTPPIPRPPCGDAMQAAKSAKRSTPPSKAMRYTSHQWQRFRTEPVASPLTHHTLCSNATVLARVTTPTLAFPPPRCISRHRSLMRVGDPRARTESLMHNACTAWDRNLQAATPWSHLIKLCMDSGQGGQLEDGKQVL